MGLSCNGDMKRNDICEVQTVRNREIRRKERKIGCGNRSIPMLMLGIVTMSSHDQTY